MGMHKLMSAHQQGRKNQVGLFAESQYLHNIPTVSQYLHDTPTLLHDTPTWLGLGISSEMVRVMVSGQGCVSFSKMDVLCRSDRLQTDTHPTS